MKKTKILLDSSALLAALQQETGSTRVANALGTTHSAMTTANLSEVLSVLATRAGIPISETLHTIVELPLTIVDISRDMAIKSAQLQEAFPKSGLSLGDRLCLAAGIIQGWPILTADRAWLKYKTGAEIELIR